MDTYVPPGSTVGDESYVSVGRLLRVWTLLSARALSSCARPPYRVIHMRRLKEVSSMSPPF